MLLAFKHMMSVVRDVIAAAIAPTNRQPFVRQQFDRSRGLGGGGEGAGRRVVKYGCGADGALTPDKGCGSHPPAHARARAAHTRTQTHARVRTHPQTHARTPARAHARTRAGTLTHARMHARTHT